jgi:hypothetical protein
MGVLGVSQRRACKTLGQVRSTQRHVAVKCKADDEARMRVIALAKEYGRYGYRVIWSFMRDEGWEVTSDLLSDGSVIRLRTEQKKHV